MRFAGLLLAALAGCAAVEADIAQEELKLKFKDLLQGGPRDMRLAKSRIEKATTRPSTSERYQYLGTQHVSHYVVQRSLRKIGNARLKDGEDLATAVDEVLHVLSHDPTAHVRSVAAEQLGVLHGRRPLPPEDPSDPDPRSGPRIHQIAVDLRDFGIRRAKGESVPDAAIVERIDALAAERPNDLLMAREMVRAIASRPAAGAAGAVKAALESRAPGIVRDAILVALRDAACGDPYASKQVPDPSPIVRLAAARALAGLRSPVARFAALRRLREILDPGEPDPDVRRALLAYLGRVGGPDAFEAARTRLMDVDGGVRLNARFALEAMTGERLGDDPASWEAFRSAHPEWSLAEAEAPAKPSR